MSDQIEFDQIESECLPSEERALFITMLVCGDGEAEGAKNICRDIVKVIMAWRRGKLLPRWEVPKLLELLRPYE
jgi:hypothetical protein